MTTSRLSMATKIIKKLISTPKAPAAIGPYSQAVVVDRTLYVSGQIGFNPDNMEIVPGGSAAEADQALKNMGHILEEAGSSFDKVVKVTVFLQNLQDYASVNEVYNRYFSTCKPARSAVQVAALPRGANVEIEAIAVTGEVTDA